MKKNVTLIILLFFTLVTKAQTTYFKAMLDGAQKAPANASAATGVVIVKYDATTKNL
jgi:hypothetical protein